MTVSVGVVLIDRHEAVTVALARADQALYAAKRGGRNRVETVEPLRVRPEGGAVKLLNRDPARA